MIPATANFKTALANFLGRGAGVGQPSIPFLIAIQGYSRVFTNFASISGGIPGVLVQPRIELDLETCAFNDPFTISGAFSGYALPAFINPSSVTKVEAVIFQNHIGGGAATAMGYVLEINGSPFSTSGLGFTLGTSTTDVVASPSATYPDPTAFPFSTVNFSASLAANIAGTYNDEALAGCALLVTYGNNQQVILLPTSFAVTGASSFWGTGTVGETGAAPGGGFLAFAPWMVSPWPQDLTQTVNDLEGGADTTNLLFNVQDGNAATNTKAAITGDFPDFVFEGAQITLVTGLPGLGGVDWTAIWTGFIDTVASDNNNLEYQFSCLDTSIKLAQVVYQTADDGGVTSSNHLKTLNANPMDILLDILQNEIVNADGSKGLDPSLIDTATIEAYRDGPFAGLQFLFHLSSPPNAHDFIKQQIMKPLGGYLFINAAGQVTVAFFYPLAGQTAAMTLGPGNWTSIPTAEQTEMVNTVEFQFDKDDADASSTGNYLEDVVQEYQPSIAQYGIYGEQVIQADGLRSSFLGYFIATFISWMYFYRYGFKNLKFDQYAAESIWQTILLETGDVVAVTHPDIPDRAAGVMGISNKPFQILDKKWNFTEGKITLTMIDASYLATFGFFEIAPNGEANYPSASAGDKATYLFMSENGEYSTGAPANILG